ncbi:separation anxiety protein like [Dichotomocladium elegans]|nr:separation anxiety protein like [Dichotomocladium elegans]
MSPSLTSLDDHVSLVDVTAENVSQLRAMHMLLFPVKYSDMFYHDVLNVGKLAKIAYYDGMCVGAVCCRREFNNTRAYIMTLGVLKTYRHLGLGSQLLKHVLNEISKDPNLTYIYLHVQISNETALRFYKKHGFEIKGIQANYYRDIEPRDAFILHKANAQRL